MVFFVTPLLFALPWKDFEVFKAEKFVFKISSVPSVGLELTTPRWGVSSATDRARDGLGVLKGRYSDLGR